MPATYGLGVHILNIIHIQIYVSSFSHMAQACVRGERGGLIPSSAIVTKISQYLYWRKTSLLAHSIPIPIPMHMEPLRWIPEVDLQPEYSLFCCTRDL